MPGVPVATEAVDKPGLVENWQRPTNALGGGGDGGGHLNQAGRQARRRAQPLARKDLNGVMVDGCKSNDKKSIDRLSGVYLGCLQTESSVARCQELGEPLARLGRREAGWGF